MNNYYIFWILEYGIKITKFLSFLSRKNVEVDKRQ